MIEANTRVHKLVTRLRFFREGEIVFRPKDLDQAIRLMREAADVLESISGTGIVSLETIDWRSVEDESPDDGCDVLVKTASPSIPVWIGHHDGDDGWRYCDGSRVAYVVTHWAAMPEGPSE